MRVVFIFDMMNILAKRTSFARILILREHVIVDLVIIELLELSLIVTGYVAGHFFRL
jgi:hypothetical protein